MQGDAPSGRMRSACCSHLRMQHGNCSPADPRLLLTHEPVPKRCVHFDLLPQQLQHDCGAPQQQQRKRQHTAVAVCQQL